MTVAALGAGAAQAEDGAMIVRPTRDYIARTGELSAMTPERDNIHWFVPQGGPAMTFDVIISGIDPGEADYEIEAIDPLVVTGKVAGVSGLLIESRGGLSRLAVGARAEIGRRGHDPLPAEVVGFRDSKALLMPFGPVEGVAPGADIRIINAATGEILRELTLDPTRDYQPTGRKPGPQKQ